MALVSLAGFLGYSAYVNLNDPDAALWSTAYCVGSLTCLTSAFRPSHRLGSVAVCLALASLGLSAYSFTQQGSGPGFADVSGKSGWVGVFELEYVREGGGALIMALALIYCSHVCKGANSKKEWITQAGVMAIAGVSLALGLSLPGYYDALGVDIASHCGGTGGKTDS
ncbi:unnamed protein product [Chrysoparadoxa australica]